MKIEFYHIDAFETPNYEPIWRALLAKGVDARMVAVPGARNRAEKDWFDYERFQQYCAERNIAYQTKVDPTADMGITTQNADILADYETKVRLMYGPVMYPNAWALQAHAVTPFDAVLTHGVAYTEFFSQWLPKEQLPVIGYPRYDDFFSGKLHKEDIRRQWHIADTKPILAFMPTWGDNTAFEKFLPILRQLVERFHIVVRPHHCTVRLEPNRMKALQESGFIILDHAYDLAAIYSAASVVVSDVRSGGLFEAVLCDVPAVGMMLDASEDAGWLVRRHIGDMLTLCHDPDKLVSSIEMAELSMPQATFRRAWSNAFVAYQDGRAAEQAAEAIIQLVLNRGKRAAFAFNEFGQLHVEHTSSSS